MTVPSKGFISMAKNPPPDIGSEGQPATKKSKPPKMDNKQVENKRMKNKMSLQEFVGSPTNPNATSESPQQQSTTFEPPLYVARPTALPYNHNSFVFNNQADPSQSFIMNPSAPGFVGQSSMTPNNPPQPTMQTAFAGSFQHPPNAHSHLPTPAGSTDGAVMASQSIFFPITLFDHNGEYMEKLRNLKLTAATRSKKGYLLEPLTAEDLEKKKKCKNCGKVMKRSNDLEGQSADKAENSLTRKSLPLKGPNSNHGKPEMDTMRDKQQTQSVKMKSLFSDIWEQEKPQTSQSGNLPTTTTTPTGKKAPVFRCKFHDGVKSRGLWSCCKKRFHEEGCMALEHHIPKEYHGGELEAIWQCYPTPVPRVSTIRSAVAIDCEMGIATSNDSELIRVTLIDYFSSEVLVDSLVYPDVPILNYNTKYSGVTPQQMNHAMRTGEVLYGKKGAREAVWRFVGPDTVVVGHSAQNDLMALRWMHSVVVDTMLVDFLREEKRRRKLEVIKAAAEKETLVQGAKKYGSIDGNRPEEFSSYQGIGITGNEIPPASDDKIKVDEQKPKKAKGGGRFSLKSMALVKLGRQIQMAGKKGHDSLEDAIASRDVAHWHVLNPFEEDLIDFADDDSDEGGAKIMESVLAKIAEVL